MFKKSIWSIILILATLTLPVTLFTKDESSVRDIYNTAEKKLSFKEYNAAIPYIEELLKISPQNSNYNFKMAYAIIRGTSHKDPLPYLEIAIKNVSVNYRSGHRVDAAPVDAIWYYALEQFYRYNYDVAKKYLQEYLAYINMYHDNYKLCTEYLACCDSGKKIMENPLKIRIKDLTEAISIKTNIHSPLFSPDGSVFIFTADKEPERENYKIEYRAYNDDIFYIVKTENGWNEPKSIGANINSSKQEASVGIHPNGKQLLIYREDEDGGNLYYSDLIGKNVWSALKKFPAPINSLANETHATISSDGRTIYFTSDREGGFGGLDIYMSKLSKDSIWGPAINLGPSINTTSYEESPHLQANSNLLYFSSNRPGGMGEYDVYRSVVEKDSIVSQVKNIGYPINSPRSDVFFKTSIDGGRAYYSTPCTSTNGELDLQMIDFIDVKLYPNVIVKGVVLTESGDTLKGLPVTLFNLNIKGITDSTKLNWKTGYYTFNLHSKNDYFISVQYDGFVYFSKPFKLSKYFADFTFQNIIILDPIVISTESLKQNEGTFVIFKKNIKKPVNDPIFDTIPNVFTAIDSLPKQNVSIESASVQSVKNTEANLNKVDIATVKNNELIEQPKEPEKPLKIEEATSVTEIVKITESKPEEPKPVVVVSVEQETKQADELLNKGISGLQEGEYNVSTKQIEQAMALYDSVGDVKKQIVCIEYLADAELETGDLNNALELHNKSLEIIEENFTKEEVSNKQIEIAEIYNDLWYKEGAVEMYENSLEIQKELKNEEEITEIYNNIADVYVQHNEQEKAIVYLENSLEFTKNEKQKAITYNKIGLSHQQLLQYSQAIEYYQKAIQIASKINDKENLASYQNNLGNAYFEIDELDEAKIHYKIALGLHQEKGNFKGMSIVHYNIGNIHSKNNENTLALESYMQSVSISEKHQIFDVLLKNYYAIMRTYEKLGNFKLSYDYYKKYFELADPQKTNYNLLSQVMYKYAVGNDDIQLLENQMQKTEELLKFEKRKYEKELELLLQKEQVLKYTRYALAGALLGIVVMLVLLLFRYSTKRKYYQQLAFQNAEILQKNEEIIVQRENLQQLNEELAKLSIVVSKTANAVAIIQKNAEVEFVNDAFLNFYGSQPSNILEFSTSIVETQKIQECFTEKFSTQYETQRTTTDKNSIWVQCMLTPILVDNQIYKIIFIESDITSQKENEIKITTQRDEIQEQADEIQQQRDVAVEQKNEIELQKNKIELSLFELQNAQKKLVESEKMASLGNLVAGISHEINTPVGIGVAATTSLLSKTESLKELFEQKKMKQSDLQSYLSSTQEATKLIQSNLQRTADLVKSFKRVSVDEMTDPKRAFNLKEQLIDIKNSLTGEVGERKVTFTINCDDAISITSYPSAFNKIISNMILNTLRHAYTPAEHAQITIDASVQDSKLLLKYSDYGKGMTAEVVQKVFNPFFTTNMQLGKGLGMNIAYNEVTKKLQGEISCESERNKGASFLCVIPISE